MAFSRATNTASSNHGLELVHETDRMQAICLKLRSEGKRISFVPTMGYLHDGHLSLLQEARTRGDILVLSIFVNPTQFGPNEDLDTYPRNLDGDLALAASAGVDYVYAPLPQDVYPDQYATYVNVEGGLTDTLCGESRPGHFRGVTTVVCKLFNIVQPHVSLFGQKDFQQLAVIRRMVRDLNLPVEIVGMPIVREEDGLAMSSRNVYLSEAERRQALSLVASIRLASYLADDGVRDAGKIIREVRERISSEPDAEIDYVRICHEETLADVSVVDRDSVLLLAVKIGNTRLIDNGYLLTD